MYTSGRLADSFFRLQVPVRFGTEPHPWQGCCNHIGSYFSPSIFLVKAAFISVCPKQQSLCPVWRSRHLLTDLIQLCIFWAFDNHFIVNMTDNEGL